MVVADRPIVERAFSRVDIVQWVADLVEGGKTEQEAQTEVFDEILRDGLAEGLLRLIGVGNTIGYICRHADRENRPARLLPDWVASPVVKTPAPVQASAPKAETALVHQTIQDAPVAVATPEKVFGERRVSQSALKQDTSMLTGKYEVPGIGLVALGEMTKSHCRALAARFLREGRSKLTYAKWFERLGDSLKGEDEQVKAKWDEPRILSLFELSEPKL